MRFMRAIGSTGVEFHTQNFLTDSARKEIERLANEILRLADDEESQDNLAYEMALKYRRAKASQA